MRTDDAQIVICKCGETVAACMAPFCYTDKDWLTDLKIYIKKGCTIKTIRPEEEMNWGKCSCKTKEAKEGLFAEAHDGN